MRRRTPSFVFTFFIAAWSLAFVAACGTRTPHTGTARSIPTTTVQERDTASTHRLLRHDPSTPGVAVGTQGAVVSAESHASRVGLEVLRDGGNAVDAAVAVGFALAVTHPSAGNIGGGGFMVIRMADGTSTCIDYRETAPSRARADMYLDAQGNPTRDSVLGARAAAIPGTVAGLALAHQRFGGRKWSALLQPAITLANKGHIIDKHHEAQLARAVEAMREAGFERSAKYYLDPQGRPIKAGQRWMQPELGRTLLMIAEHGPQGFYHGLFARKLAAGVQSLGGIWSVDDLQTYRAVEREPIGFDYRGHRIISMPPPSAGGVVLRQILGASELYKIGRYPWHSIQEIHLYVEAARRSYADRNFWLGDPDFVSIPIKDLTDMAYIAARMRDIDPQKATPSERVAAGRLPAESPETTHYSIVDRAGNAVSNTYTLNTGFGSKQVVPGTGILLNNEMDDFAAKPGQPNTYGLVQGDRNRIEPGKRMLSSMTPTIVVKDGQLRAVLGTPGGSTITTTVVQLIRNLIDYQMPLDEAVRAPRIHHQWQPDQIIIESALSESVMDGLQALGHRVVISDQGRIGRAMCIEVDPETPEFRAVADITRGSGEAVAF
jgi:gamma-glutamyltranspeptidase/glutathione hydrolase